MALFTTDLKPELNQIKSTINEIFDKKVNPSMNGAIATAGQELSKVVKQARDDIDVTLSKASTELNALVIRASAEVQAGIEKISTEIHQHRSLTADDLKLLVDYAAQKMGETMDKRLQVAKQEATAFVTERVAHLKNELEDAAIKSRKTLYANLAISLVTALGMAAIGVIYKKISIGELDVFAAFRVFLLSAATGTAVFSGLKIIQNWMGLNKNKKNAATIFVNQLSVLRPNGAIGLFICSVLLVVAWLFVSHYF